MPAPDRPRRSPWILLPVFAGWYLILASTWHAGFPPGTLPRHAWVLLLAILILGAGGGIGSWIRRWILPTPVSAPLSILLSLGLGLGALELILFAAMATGIATPVAGWALVSIALAAGGFGLLGGTGRAASFDPECLPTARRPWAIALLGVASLAWLVALAAALAPAEFYDALIYHLAVPDLLLRQGGLGGVDGNFYSLFPANQGMLYALGMLLAGNKLVAGSLAQVIHLALGAGTVLATFTVGARHLSVRVGILGAGLLAVVPGILLTATWPVADLAVAFNGILVVACLLEARGAQDRPAERRWILTAGLFAGLALGVKYTAAPVVLLPAAALLIWRARRAERRHLVHLAIFLAAIAAAFAPWAARNVAVAGDPLAPYLGPMLGSEERGPTLPEEIRRRGPEETGPEGLARYYLGSPWRLSTERIGAGGYLGIAFLLLVPFVLLRRNPPPAVGTLAFLALAGLAGWTLSVQVTRYLFPALPAFALLAAQGAQALARAAPVLRVAVAMGLGWVVLHGLYIFSVLVITINPFGVVAGVEMPEDYLARRVAYYEAARHLNEQAPEGSRISTLR